MDTAYRILINAQSGTVLKTGRDGVLAAVEASGINAARVDFLEPSEMETVLDECGKDDMPLLICGGDGTIMKAIQPLLKANKSVGFIPMGTMNLLAQDLNIPVGLLPALEAYAKGTKTMRIDVALANDIPFLCAAGIGVMPEASEFREQNRGQIDILLMPRLTLFVFDRLDHLKRRTFRLLIDGYKKRLKTTSLIISNNRFAVPEEDTPLLTTANNFKKETLQDGLLGIYAATPRTIWDRVRLILKLSFGGWHRDGVIREYQTKELVVFTRRKEESVSLDGELFRIRTPLRFRIRRRALRVIVPLSTEKEG